MKANGNLSSWTFDLLDNNFWNLKVIVRGQKRPKCDQKSSKVGQKSPKTKSRSMQNRIEQNIYQRTQVQSPFFLQGGCYNFTHLHQGLHTGETTLIYGHIFYRGRINPFWTLDENQFFGTFFCVDCQISLHTTVFCFDFLLGALQSIDASRILQGCFPKFDKALVGTSVCP